MVILTRLVFTKPGDTIDKWLNVFLAYAFALNGIVFLIYAQDPISIFFEALLFIILVALPECLGALDCDQNCILFPAGAYSLIVLIKNWKGIKAFQYAA